MLLQGFMREWIEFLDAFARIIVAGLEVEARIWWK